MTDIPPDILDQPAVEPDDWGEGDDPADDLPVEQVRELFGVFVKALRSFQLYDEQNPVRKRFVSTLREAFELLWREVEGLNLLVEEHRFLLAGEEIYENSSRSDSLAFLLYKDGIRDVTFLPGVEGNELDRVLGVLQRARMLKSAESDDLLTMLWEQDLKFFKCRCVDQITEGAETPTAQPVEDRANLAQVLQAEIEDDEAGEDVDGEAGAAEDGPPPKVGQDFSPALYGLDPEEADTLRRQLAAEMSRDVTFDVLAALFDRLEESGYPERKSEILKILRELLPNLLVHGDVESAAGVLEELAAVRAEPEVLDEVRQRECDELLDDLSSPVTIGGLVHALQDGTIDVPVGVLGRFLRFLRAGALSPLLQASEEEEIPALKETLRGAVHGIAEKNPEAVLALLHNANSSVTAGAARLVGEMRMAEAAPKLAGLIAHADPAVRLAVVESAQILGEAITTDTLVGALSDPERDVRIASARALMVLGHEPAAPALEASVRSKEIRKADLTEKIAIFESYAMLGGDAASAVLTELLRKKGFFGRSEPSEIRASAAQALGKAGRPAAREALVAAQNDDDVVVRTAVRKAIQRVQEVVT